MKLKRRAQEVPPKIRAFINSVTTAPLENIEEPLKCFVWEFDKGDFHHWVDLFNHFDSFFEKYIKSRKELQLEDDFLDSDPPFPKASVLQILRVIRIILENCTNKHFHSSYEQHLSALLASTDVDVVEACLQTLAAFLKKTVGKFSIRDASLKSKLYALAQGWGVKEEGLGLVACALENGCDPVARELGSSLHFEYYAVSESANGQQTEGCPQGLRIIHLPNTGSHQESDLQLLHSLISEHKVPSSLRFSLLTRLRYAKAFGSLASRQQYTCIRLYAFIVLVKASIDADDLVSFFNAEPEFINELLSLLSYEEAVPEKIRVLCLLSLVALCQDRSRQPSVLSAVTSGGHRGILSSLVQKAIDSVISGSSKWSVVFAEALLSLVTALVSSSTGCSAMREAGFIATLLPLLKDTDPQHLHLVSTAVHILEAFMDYSNPAAALFRELGGLDDTITRLKLEVSYVENGSKQQVDASDCSGTSTAVISDAASDLDNVQSLYSDALVSYHRRMLMKALLHAISLGTYAPGNSSSVYGSDESLLPHCLRIIFQRAKDFGGGVFSLAATVMSDLIHKDPTCFPVLEAAGLPSAFLDAILDGVVCSSEAVSCIPQCLDALCLNNNGLQGVKDRNALRCFVKVFTSRSYMRALTGDTPGSLSSGLDELLRHASSLREPGVEMLVEILNTISNIGSGIESSNLAAELSTSVPMETDTEGTSSSSPPEEDGSKIISDQTLDPLPNASVSNIEAFLPVCVSNAACLLETVLQNAETCRIFVEKKGIEAVLQLLTLPLMPVSVSLGHNMRVAFKNFSLQHYGSLARGVCSFLREYSKSTGDLLVSTGGVALARVDSVVQAKVLRNLSVLEGILCLCAFLLKGATALFAELGSGDAEVLKELGRTYREVIWQKSVCEDSKVEEEKTVEQGPESADAGPSNPVGRESDDDANIPAVRYMNPVSVRSGSQSMWSGEREFFSVRSGESLHRRSRHGFSRIRGGRTGRHLEVFNLEIEAQSNAADTSSQSTKNKTPDVLVFEILGKLESSLRSFFTAIVKGFTSSNRRRGDAGTMGSASKALGSALAKIFLEGLTFTGHPSSEGLDMPLSVKCRYLGKVVDDMAAVTFDSRRHTCYAAMINNFYVHGTFKELLTTFEATSQLLWTPPYSAQTVVSEHEKVAEETKLSHSTWLRDTLQSYRRELEYFVNAGYLLSPTSTSHSSQAQAAQLLVQPVTTGLSIGLFPVPRDPDVFVQMLQSQVLDVILPVWNHQMFPSCNPDFVASIISLVTHVYSGVGDVKRSRTGITGSSNQHYSMPPPPLDEATIATIVEMGFTRARAEEALRRVETNSVEMAMEWLFTHPEDPVQEDDELARALALSLGSSSEAPKPDATDKSMDVAEDVNQKKAPPVDDILSALVKLFQNSDVLSFPLTDLLVTLCNRSKGEDRPKVIAFLIQQLKRCKLDFSSESGALGMILHVMALVLSEDGGTREIASRNGIVSIAIDILMNFKASNELVHEVMVPKCISALLLILDNMLQPRPKVLSANSEGIVLGSLPDSSPEQASLAVRVSNPDKDAVPESHVDESGAALEKIFGNSTGYLTIEEGHKLLQVACDFIKQQVPSLVMQAVLQLCARLTKTYDLALEFLERGALTALFSLPRACFFPGYDTVASAIIKHLIEDPQTLQTAMELEIRQTLSGSRHAGRITPPLSFLTAMAPVISRDPAVFMRAAASICQLESSGGRTYVVLVKEKDKSKASGSEAGLVLNESGKLPESKMHDGSVKCSKGHRKVPANLAQVIDQLLDIVVKFPSSRSQDSYADDLTLMDVDKPAGKVKGKSKVDADSRKTDPESERSAGLAKVTFILKLLSDILLMYAHAAGVILKRDLELSNQFDESANYGILHHILHNLVALSAEKFAGPDEWRQKLSEKASLFLVVLCGRSSEGRRRVVTELVKTFSSFANTESNSSGTTLLPTKIIFSFAELTYSILSKNSSSSNLPSSGCSADVAKSMIDGGMVQCLADVLQVIDLDHPDAPKTVNLIVKSLESLTRAANMSEQVIKSDVADKKKIGSLNDTVVTAPSPTEMAEDSQHRSNQQEASNAVDAQEQQHQGSPQTEGNTQDENADLSTSQDVRNRIEETMASSPVADLGIDYIREDMEEGGPPHSANHIEVTIRVDNRGDDDMGDDDMADDADEDDDDEDGEDEDEAEDGTGMMSLADTDVEDHDDTGLGDDFNDEMIDEEDDDFHENRVIEVRWREALDGLDHHLQVLGQPGAASGLIDVAAEPFEGVNVDDLYGIRRSLGFERRRQTVRSSYDRSAVEASGFQHPLLLRPNQSAGTLSRDLESLSSEGNDASHIYMFDAPVLTYDHAPSSLFSSRLTGSLPPPLADYSLGLDSLQLPGRRGLGDGRWTDDGQPQAGTQATAIAQAVEEQFLSYLRQNTRAEQQLESAGVQEKQQFDAPNSESQQIVEGDNGGAQQGEGQHEENDNVEENQGSDPSNDQVNDAIESTPCQEPVNPESTAEVSMSVQPLSLNSTPNRLDNMEIGNGNGSAAGEAETFLEFVISSMEAGGQGGSSVLADVAAHTDQATNHFDIPEDAQAAASGHISADVEMNSVDPEDNEVDQSEAAAGTGEADLSLGQDMLVAEDAADQPDQTVQEVASGNAIDPTFLEALPEDLRAEVLASQQAQSVQPPAYVPPSAEEIDPEFLAALPPEIQAEVLAQQRAQRATQQLQAAQPVDMDNASIIATFPADLREEVLLTSSEAVLSALPSQLLAEAQMLRDRAASHYQARTILGGSHRLNNRRSGLGFDRPSAMDRGVGVTIGQRAASTVSDGLKVKEFEGQPLLDAKALTGLIRLLRLAQPLGKGLLQRLLLNLCAHSTTRANLVALLLSMMKPEAESSASGFPSFNSQRLYGCQSNTIFGRSQLLDGLPPLVLRRILEILTYLATNHSAVANMLFYFDSSILSESSSTRYLDSKSYKGKEKVVEGVLTDLPRDSVDNVPLVVFLKLLDRPLSTQSTTHFEQVLGLIQVIVYGAAARLESQARAEQEMVDAQMPPEQPTDVEETDPSTDPNNSNKDNKLQDKSSTAESSSSAGKTSVNTYDVFLQLPQPDLRNLCSLLGREGLSDKVYLLASEVLKKLARVAVPLRKLFILALSELAHDLSGSAVNELVTLRNTHMLGLSAGSMAGAAMLRVLQALNSLATSSANASSGFDADTEQEQARMWKLYSALESLWQELSDCIGMAEAQLSQSSLSPMSDVNIADHVMGIATSSSSLPPGTQRLLPYIEAFFVLSEKLQASHSPALQDHVNNTANEDAGSSSSSATKSVSDFQKKSDGSVTFMRFAEKHRRLLNAFVRQNPGLMENSLSMLLKTPRLVDFDNKRAYFRSRIRQQHEHGLSGPLRISVRRAYVLEDSYNQLRMRSTQELKGRLNVQFQGEEGIDAGGLTREWYQLLSRVIFDRNALLFTTVGNNATFQPNPNSVYQTEHLSYFKFVGRVVAKALFDGQLLDVHFTRSFYKHILGIKVTYHDIEAVDPDYYKNLKWMLENDVSDILDLTFSMDADEEKHILYEKNEVTDYELKPGGRNIRVTEETKHEYVDLVADHILTNAIRTQINSFLEGFSELIPRDLISIFNDKELELLISGLPEIDLDDLKANTEYSGFTAASSVVQWFWEVVKAFNKEDMARLLQFVTGTSKVPLEGFKALQGISGPQRFQIHKAYGAPVRLPSAHTCFNQLDLPEYTCKEQLQERLLLAIHEASEGFGFG